MSDIKWFINNGDYFYFKDAPAHLSGVSLDKSEISLSTVGQTEQLTATIIPSNPVETVSLNWSSSDTSIATVDNTGLVTCVTPGSCTITVTTTPGSYTASCSVIKVFEFSYNLVNAGSVAQMQSDGWEFTRQSGTATSGWGFTSNGLHNTNTGSSDKFGSITLAGALDCSDAKKITVQVEHYLISGSWNGASSYGIGNSSYSAGGNIQSMNNSGYNGYAGRNPSTSSRNRLSLATGSYTGTTVLDLVNKTQVTSLTGNTDITLTLSDSDVDAIKAFTNISLGYDNVGNYYKSIYIKIE